MTESATIVIVNYNGAHLLPPCLEGLRRRTRVMNGRCQGFYCGADVQNLLDCHGRTDTSAPPAHAGASTLQESH